MTLLEFIEKYQITGQRIMGVARLLYPNECLIKTGKSHPIRFIKRHLADATVPKIHLLNLLGEIVIINKMVKSNDCPNNVKNKFYAIKHKVLKCLYFNGYVMNIENQGRCLLYNIDGGYQFHQLTSSITYLEKDLVEIIDNGVEYVPATQPIPFNQSEWNNFLLSIYCYNSISDMVNKLYPMK